MGKFKEDDTKELDNIQSLLRLASEYNLECEVIYYALRSMKENPTLTPTEAFNNGMEEWKI